MTTLIFCGILSIILFFGGAFLVVSQEEIGIGTICMLLALTSGIWVGSSYQQERTCEYCGSVNSTVFSENHTKCEECGRVQEEKTVCPVCKSLVRSAYIERYHRCSACKKTLELDNGNVSEQTQETQSGTKGSSKDDTSQNTVYCGKCGAAVEAGNSFCTNCGEKLN